MTRWVFGCKLEVDSDGTSKNQPVLAQKGPLQKQRKKSLLEA